jgi:hypothetical protein
VVSVTANASDTGDGGASVVGAYQIDPGFPETTLVMGGALAHGVGWLGVQVQISQSI